MLLVLIHIFTFYDVGVNIQNIIYTLQYNKFKIKLSGFPDTPTQKKMNSSLVDLAVKTVITSPIPASYTQIILFSDIRTLITNICQLRWHQKLTSYYTKLNRIKHSTDNWKFPIEIHRQFEIIITRLRIGHAEIYHRFLMAKEEPQMCPSCGVQVTISHIITECRKYQNLQTKLNLPESLPEILINYPQSISNIIQFITITNLKTKI